MRRYLLLLAIAALATAALAGGALAASLPSPHGPRTPLRDEPEFEGGEEGGEGEFEGCEAILEEEDEVEFLDARWHLRDSEGEFEECVEEEVKPTGKRFVTAAPECLVRRAESRIKTALAAGEIKLTLRYITYDPTQVAIGIKAKGHRGSLTLLHTTKHLGAKGTLHLTAKVGGGAAEKLAQASEFDVSLRAPRTPAFCAPELEQRLATGKGGGSKN